MGVVAMRSKSVLTPDVSTQRLEFLTRPCCDCWYGNSLSAAWGQYTWIKPCSREKWYTYVIHAKNEYTCFSAATCHASHGLECLVSCVTCCC